MGEVSSLVGKEAVEAYDKFLQEHQSQEVKRIDLKGIVKYYINNHLVYGKGSFTFDFDRPSPGYVALSISTCDIIVCTVCNSKSIVSENLDECLDWIFKSYPDVVNHLGLYIKYYKDEMDRLFNNMIEADKNYWLNNLG